MCLTGVAQGIITGIRGLCNGLGPAMFGCVFYMFHVNLSEDNKNPDPIKPDNTSIPLFQTSLKVGAIVLCVLRQSRAWEDRRCNQGSLWASATVLCVLRQGRAWEDRRCNQGSLWAGAAVLCVLKQGWAWGDRRCNQGSLLAGATVLCVLRQSRAWEDRMCNQDSLLAGAAVLCVAIQGLGSQRPRLSQVRCQAFHTFLGSGAVGLVP